MKEPIGVSDAACDLRNRFPKRQKKTLLTPGLAHFNFSLSVCRVFSFPASVRVSGIPGVAMLCCDCFGSVSLLCDTEWLTLPTTLASSSHIEAHDLRDNKCGGSLLWVKDDSTVCIQSFRFVAQSAGSIEFDGTIRSVIIGGPPVKRFFTLQPGQTVGVMSADGTAFPIALLPPFNSSKLTPRFSGAEIKNKIRTFYGAPVCCTVDSCTVYTAGLCSDSTSVDPWLQVRCCRLIESGSQITTTVIAAKKKAIAVVSVSVGPENTIAIGVASGDVWVYEIQHDALNEIAFVSGSDTQLWRLAGAAQLSLQEAKKAHLLPGGRFPRFLGYLMGSEVEALLWYSSGTIEMITTPAPLFSENSRNSIPGFSAFRLPHPNLSTKLLPNCWTFEQALFTLIVGDEGSDHLHFNVCIQLPLKFRDGNVSPSKSQVQQMWRTGDLEIYHNPFKTLRFFTGVELPGWAKQLILDWKPADTSNYRDTKLSTLLWRRKEQWKDCCRSCGIEEITKKELQISEYEKIIEILENLSFEDSDNNDNILLCARWDDLMGGHSLLARKALIQNLVWRGQRSAALKLAAAEGNAAEIDPLRFTTFLLTSDLRLGALLLNSTFILRSSSESQAMKLVQHLGNSIYSAVQSFLKNPEFKLGDIATTRQMLDILESFRPRGKLRKKLNHVLRQFVPEVRKVSETITRISCFFQIVYIIGMKLTQIMLEDDKSTHEAQNIPMKILYQQFCQSPKHFVPIILTTEPLASFLPFLPVQSLASLASSALFREKGLELFSPAEEDEGAQCHKASAVFPDYVNAVERYVLASEVVRSLQRLNWPAAIEAYRKLAAKFTQDVMAGAKGVLIASERDFLSSLAAAVSRCALLETPSSDVLAFTAVHAGSEGGSLLTTRLFLVLGKDLEITQSVHSLV